MSDRYVMHNCVGFVRSEGRLLIINLLPTEVTWTTGQTQRLLNNWIEGKSSGCPDYSEAHAHSISAAQFFSNNKSLLSSVLESYLICKVI